jgi:hypothetical protein
MIIWVARRVVRQEPNISEEILLPISGMKSTPSKKPSVVEAKLGSLPASAGFFLSLHFVPEDGGNVPQKHQVLFEYKAL